MIKKWYHNYNNKKLCSKGKLPDYYCNYLNTANSKPKKNTTLESLRFLVLDTETTGLNLKKDVLISIGAIVVQNLSIEAKTTYEVYVKQEELWTTNTVLIHEITKSEMMNGISKAAAAASFLNLLNNAIFVAHHNYFDRIMIQNMIREVIPNFEFFNTMIDTVALLKKVENTGTQRMYHIQSLPYNLDAVIERHGLIAEDRHTAWGDAFTTAHLLIKTLKKLKANGAKTLGDIL